MLYHYVVTTMPEEYVVPQLQQLYLLNFQHPEVVRQTVMTICGRLVAPREVEEMVREAMRQAWERLDGPHGLVRHLLLPPLYHLIDALVAAGISSTVTKQLHYWGACLPMTNEELEALVEAAEHLNSNAPTVCAARNFLRSNSELREEKCLTIRR